jgi:hypothetical protein
LEEIMAERTTMNRQPLQYAVYYETTMRQFIGSSHIKIERARGVAAHEAQILGPAWSLYVVKLAVPGYYDQFGPLPRFEILEGPMLGQKR